MEHDLHSQYVLISHNFYNFRKDPIPIPTQFYYIIKKGPKHKSNFTPPEISKFIEWLSKLKST